MILLHVTMYENETLKNNVSVCLSTITFDDVLLKGGGDFRSTFICIPLPSQILAVMRYLGLIFLFRGGEVNILVYRRNTVIENAVFDIEIVKAGFRLSVSVHDSVFTPDTPFFVTFRY